MLQLFTQEFNNVTVFKTSIEIYRLNFHAKIRIISGPSKIWIFAPKYIFWFFDNFKNHYIPED